MKNAMRTVILGALLLSGVAASAQWAQNSWSVQIDGGLLYDVYSPGKDQNIIDIPVKDMRSFYSEKDQFNPNINLYLTYASSPLWGWTAGYGYGIMSGSNETDFYTARMHNFDAGLKFFSANMNPAMVGAKWSLTPMVLLSYTDFQSNLYFISDNSLQNIEDGAAFGHVLGAELAYSVNSNWTLYGLFQHRTVYSDGLDGWDYGTGSDQYLRMNLGVKYRFTKKSDDAEELNVSDINMWSTVALAAVPSISERLTGNTEQLSEASEELKKEVIMAVEEQSRAAEKQSQELEEAMAELRRKDNELFEKVNQTSIFFDSESARLKPEMRQELFIFNNNLEGSSWDGTYEIIITAFTDKYGDAEYNANLRDKRADAVSKYLQEELDVKVSIRQLTAAHDQLGDHILDRRVELSVKVIE